MVIPAKLVQIPGFEKYILNKQKRFSVSVVASRTKNDSQEYEGLSIKCMMITHPSIYITVVWGKKE